MKIRRPKLDEIESKQWQSLPDYQYLKDETEGANEFGQKSIHGFTNKPLDFSELKKIRK